MSTLDQAVEEIGLQPLAQLLGVSYQAIRKWQRNGRLPRTEWTGETDYAARIEQASGGKFTRDALLARPVALIQPADVANSATGAAA